MRCKAIRTSTPRDPVVAYMWKHPLFFPNYIFFFAGHTFLTKLIRNTLIFAFWLSIEVKFLLVSLTPPTRKLLPHLFLSTSACFSRFFVTSRDSSNISSALRFPGLPMARIMSKYLFHKCCFTGTTAGIVSLPLTPWLPADGNTWSTPHVQIFSKCQVLRACSSPLTYFKQLLAHNFHLF